MDTPIEIRSIEGSRGFASKRTKPETYLGGLPNHSDMESEIFDRETILDLMVNFIPLGIILFFIGTFAVFTPWGFDLMPSGQMFGIMGIMFVALLVLTYLSAKAIAGDEKRATVYAQGQAGLEGATPLHELEADAESEGAETSPQADGMEAEDDVSADTETATDESATSE